MNLAVRTGIRLVLAGGHIQLRVLGHLAVRLLHPANQRVIHRLSGQPAGVGGIRPKHIGVGVHLLSVDVILSQQAGYPRKNTPRG